jgi:hypothetical protein
MRRRLQVDVTPWVREGLALGLSLHYLSLSVLQTQTVLNLSLTRSLLLVSVHPRHQIQVLRMTDCPNVSGERFRTTGHNFNLCHLRFDVPTVVKMSFIVFLVTYGYEW